MTNWLFSPSTNICVLLAPAARHYVFVYISLEFGFLEKLMVTITFSFFYYFFTGMLF